MAPGPPFRLAVLGRLHGVTRRRLALACERAGGRALRRIGPSADIVVVAHGAATTVLADAPPVRLPGLDADFVSENSALRMLGISPPRPEDIRTLDTADLARGSGLDLDTLEALALFDVIDPLDGLYPFTDLVAAREVARLRQRGFPLALIVEAATRLGRSGRSLADSRLAETPSGDIVQVAGGRAVDLDGQFMFDLGDTAASVDDLFERAEQAETEGSLERAERLYRIAMEIDRSDPTIPFNLGNVLDARGRPAEAALAYRQALARDPRFAEALLNLAVLAETAGRPDEAGASYRQALSIRPDYHDALFSFALFLTRRAHFDEAAQMWRRALAAGGDAEDAREAWHMLMFCRGARNAGE